jgi:hypothetical protein
MQIMTEIYKIQHEALTTYLLISMEHSPQKGDESCSDNQEITHPLVET